MRKRSKCLAAIVALLGVLALQPAAAGEAQQFQPPQKVQEVLRRTAKTYSAMDQYVREFTVTQRMVTSDGTNELSISMAVAAERPNKLRTRIQVGEQSMLAVSDGQVYWVFLPTTNKFLKKSAPDDIQGLIAQKPLSQIVRGDIKGLTLGLLGPEPYQTLTRGLTEAEYVGTAQVGQQETDHLRLRTSRVETELWLGREDGEVLRAEMTPWRMLQRLAEQKPDLKDVTVALDYGPAPDEFHQQGRFSFEPPADASEAAGIAELMGQGPAPQQDKTGQAMTDFTLPGLQRDSWHLAELKGKVIALDFWATWCPPCRQELPKLQQIYDELKGEGFVLLAVNVGEAEQKVKSFMQQQGLEVPVALDREQKTASAYGIEALPTLFLIGREGKIRHVQRGYAPGVEEEIKQRAQDLLAEEPASQQ